MRSMLFRGVDRYMNFIDSESRFWGVVIILVAALLFGPVCLNIFFK